VRKLLDGAISPSGLVLGTYVHGIFDNDLFRHSFLDWARASLKLAAAGRKVFASAERETRLDRWADHLRRSLRLLDPELDIPRHDQGMNWPCLIHLQHTQLPHASSARGQPLG